MNRSFLVAAASLIATLTFLLGGMFGVVAGRAKACHSSVTVVELASLSPSWVWQQTPVTLTGYSSTVDQTDSSPCIGAIGDNVCTLRARGFVALAVTPDIERLVPMGTVLLVADRLNPCLTRDRAGKCVVLRTRQVDIHFVDRGSALRWGIRRGTVEVSP